MLSRRAPDAGLLNRLIFQTGGVQAVRPCQATSRGAPHSRQQARHPQSSPLVSPRLDQNDGGVGLQIPMFLILSDGPRTECDGCSHRRGCPSIRCLRPAAAGCPSVHPAAAPRPAIPVLCDPSRHHCARAIPSRLRLRDPTEAEVVFAAPSGRRGAKGVHTDSPAISTEVPLPSKGGSLLHSDAGGYFRRQHVLELSGLMLERPKKAWRQRGANPQEAS